MSHHVPCRLHVVMAREANVAVILRRGPSKWYQVIKWDTKTDNFEDGAWFHGQIAEEACDLSPDGKLFVYFASKYDRRQRDTEYGHNWTAVSRPPWLFALGLWPSNTDSYPGGGRFIGNDQLCVLYYGPFDPPTPRPDHPISRKLKIQFKRWREFGYDRTTHADGGEWSGRDQQGRPVFTKDGKLFRREGIDVVEVIDLNDRTPNPQPAPEWARH